MNNGYTEPHRIPTYRKLEEQINPVHNLQSFLERNPFPWLVQIYQESPDGHPVKDYDDLRASLTIERIIGQPDILPETKQTAYPVRVLGEHPFKGTQLFIGRTTHCDIPLPDKAVSKSHAYFIPDYSLDGDTQRLLRVADEQPQGEQLERLLHLYDTTSRGLWLLRDNNSTNGSYINGLRITEDLNPCSVKDGDLLAFGNGVYRFLWPRTFFEDVLFPEE